MISKNLLQKNELAQDNEEKKSTVLGPRPAPSPAKAGQHEPQARPPQRGRPSSAAARG